MNKYQWKIKKPIAEEIRQKFPEVNPIILQLLIDRGLTTQEQIDEFLHPDYSQDIHDPFLFSQMKQAVDRIYQSKENQGKAVIYGDYDADGVCGSAILAKVFKEIGLDFEVYLPDRGLEGYGLNEEAIKELASQNVKLIITVDCGISNVKEVSLANELGLEVIITDHHHVAEELPKALAIIHPGWDKNYPFKKLAGGGVAFKLAQAILQDPRLNIKETNVSTLEKWLLDLVAISTVADMVPLVGENRTLVKHGLIVLSKTKNLGLQKLIEITGIKKTDTYTIGWQIAPRINAAGRMDHANSAYQLLTTENIEEAITIAHGLNKSNQERQSLTESLIEQAKEQVGEAKDDLPIIFAQGKGWPPGVIGLVSSKLTNIYARPSIVLSEKDDHLVASGRSIGEFNLIEALDRFKDYFEKYGGHSGAAGFSIKIERYEDFKAKFTDYAKEKLTGVKFIPKLIIDLEISLKEIDWPLIESLNQFEPFGQSNYCPRFLIRNVKVMSRDSVGHDNKHLRLIVGQENLQRKVICFSFGDYCQKIEPEDIIDIVCEASVNEWNGTREIQLSLVDLKISNERQGLA
ncbi:single-stranded-DNA-specific exonuclease RecJ [Patescibacteria group bacterium]|nr:single-stranded-DNA-specific exonuclease RecJ [Patescibacteria group bacterium]